MPCLSALYDKQGTSPVLGACTGLDNYKTRQQKYNKETNMAALNGESVRIDGFTSDLTIFCILRVKDCKLD